jgi:hypothetical protein
MLDDWATFASPSFHASRIEPDRQGMIPLRAMRSRKMAPRPLADSLEYRLLSMHRADVARG